MNMASDQLNKDAKTGRKVKLSRKSLHEQVADELREQIISGVMKPGEKLAVNELALNIGVSATPLREAIKLLAAENLIEIEPHRGASVALITIEQTRHLFEVISGIESLAAELATTRMTESERDQLLALHEKMRSHFKDESPAKYFDCNRQIHDAIVAYARNPILSEHRDKLAQQAARVRFFALKDSRRREEGMQEHEDLMRAFEKRDSDAARSIWRKHLNGSGSQMIRLLKDG
jgi:DNA-binding GntR family transcriptional regulator